MSSIHFSLYSEPVVVENPPVAPDPISAAAQRAIGGMDAKQVRTLCDVSGLKEEEMGALLEVMAERGGASGKIGAKDHALARSIIVIDGVPYLLMTKTRLGDLVLGEGAFKKTKIAIRLSDGKRFAVGVVKKAAINEGRREEIRNEIALMRRCNGSAHIIGLEAALETDEKFYILTELGIAGDLHTFMQERELDIEERLEIASAYLQSAAEVQKRKIIHRDLKPSNVYPWWNQDEKFGIKIGDFGAAAHGNLWPALNCEKGTYLYWPPELARTVVDFGREGHANFTRAYATFHDPWSVGIALFEILHPEHRRPHFTEEFRGSGKFRIIADLTDDEIERELIALTELLEAKGEYTEGAYQMLLTIQNLLKVNPVERSSLSIFQPR